MNFLKNLAYRAAYFTIHPLLRFYRVHISPPRDSARVVLMYHDEILLVRNIGVKRWSLPGGAMKKGETHEECALRELNEELHIKAPKLERKLGTYNGVHHDTAVQVHVFVVRTLYLDRKKQWEIEEARWFDLHSLPPNLSPATARRIGDYKNNLTNTTGFW